MHNGKQQEADPALSFYTPDRVLDIAYCYYLASVNNEDRLRPTHKLALQVILDFETACAAYDDKMGTPEWKFMSCIKQVIVSLARGIERRRYEVEKFEERAFKEREHRIHEMTTSTKRSGLLKAAWRTLMLGGIGFIMAKAFIPWVHLEHSVQPTYASLAVSLIVALVGSLIAAIIADRRIKKIFNMHDSKILEAQEVYRRSTKEEYIRAKKDATHIWVMYTGSEPQDWPGYETILEEEQELADMMKRHRDQLLANPFTQILRGAGSKVVTLTLYAKTRLLEPRKRNESVN